MLKENESLDKKVQSHDLDIKYWRSAGIITGLALADSYIPKNLPIPVRIGTLIIAGALGSVSGDGASYMNGKIFEPDFPDKDAGQQGSDSVE